MRHTAYVLVALSMGATGASAQSVLERVLGQIVGATNLAPVNGVYANIAESIGDPGRFVTSTVPGERELNVLNTVSEGDVLLVFAPGTSPVEFLAVVGPVDEFGSRFLLFADNSVGIAGGVGPSYGPFLLGSPLFEDANGILTARSQLMGFSYQEISGFADFSFSTTMTTTTDTTLSEGDVILVNFDFGGGSQEVLAYVSADGSLLYADNSTGQAGLLLAGAGTATIGAQLFEGPGGILTVQANTLSGPFQNVSGFSDFVELEATTEITSLIPGFSTTIDGSITNIVTGVTLATDEALAGAASAAEFAPPTVDFGNMATTALGAVNTGAITLGVNAAVDEAATTTTRAISATMTQIGGSADTGALVLNLASNASSVNGSIQNTLLALNGSIGDLSTTALGAVNTGAITAGVNASVQGIVGMSGQ